MTNIKNTRALEVGELVADKLIDAIAIMDERGRLNVGAQSTMLWNKEWNRLRLEIFESLELLKSVIE